MAVDGGLLAELDHLRVAEIDVMNWMLVSRMLPVAIDRSATMIVMRSTFYSASNCRAAVIWSKMSELFAYSREISFYWIQPNPTVLVSKIILRN